MGWAELRFVDIILQKAIGTRDVRIVLRERGRCSVWMLSLDDGYVKYLDVSCWNSRSGNSSSCYSLIDAFRFLFLKTTEIAGSSFVTFFINVIGGNADYFTTKLLRNSFIASLFPPFHILDMKD